jgi:hypothetical protein
MIRARWTWLAMLAVLFGGLTNAHAHVHYCFDGKEPPAAVHLSDRIDHAHESPGHDYHDDHDHDADHDSGKHDEHDDLDVDLPNQAIAKVFKYDQPAIAPLPRWHAPIARVTLAALPPHVEAPPAPDPPHTLPPSRGPPL